MEEEFRKHRDARSMISLKNIGYLEKDVTVYVIKSWTYFGS